MLIFKFFQEEFQFSISGVTAAIFHIFFIQIVTKIFAYSDSVLYFLILRSYSKK
jgi:hypothetical protein